MLNLPTYITRIFVTIIISVYFLSSFETLGQENNIPPSLFKQCWKLETDKITPYEIGSDNKGHIYLPLVDGKIVSIDLITGIKIWESDFGSQIISPPLSDEKSIYIISKTGARILLRSLSKDFGITNWTVNLDFKGEVFFIKSNDKLVISSKDGKFTVVDKNSGELVWSKSFEQELSSTPILLGSWIVFGTISKKIFFYSIESGSLLSQFKTSTSPTIIFAIRNKYLFWGDYNGNAYLSDLKIKKIFWKVRSGAEILSILLTRQGVLISSLDNFIYLVSIETGKFIWKRRLNGRLSFNSIIVDKYLITVTFASEVVDVISIETGKLLNQFIIEDGNYFINKPLLSNDLFIFPTIKGLVAFANEKTRCPSDGIE